MNRYEFMKKLEDLLSDIPPSERESAIGYYEDYLDDAGPENEASILEELESPEKVSKIIRAGMEDADDNVGEFTERGYEDTRFAKEKETPDIIHGVPVVKGGAKGKSEDETDEKKAGSTRKAGYTGAGSRNADGGPWQGDPGKSQWQNGSNNSRWEHGANRDQGGSRWDNRQGYDYQYGGKKTSYTEKYGDRPKMSRGAKIALIIILCFLAIPVGIPLIAGVFGVLVGVIAAVFGVFFAVGIVGIVLIVCGLMVTFIGFIKMMVVPGVGLLAGGIGLMMAALGLAALVCFIWLCGRVLPGFIRWITGLLHRLVRRGGNMA